MKRFLAIFLGSTVLAAEAPPLKPGLWQATTESAVDGRALPNVTQTIQSMRPEVRARMDAMAKARGVGTTGNGSDGLRFCMDRHSLNNGSWQSQPQQGHCTTTFKVQAASGWKWRTVCSVPQASGTVVADGEARFLNPESYQVKVMSTTQMHGQTSLVTTSMTAKWLAADCGDLKPRAPNR